MSIFLRDPTTCVDIVLLLAHGNLEVINDFLQISILNKETCKDKDMLAKNAVQNFETSTERRIKELSKIQCILAST